MKKQATSFVCIVALALLTSVGRTQSTAPTASTGHSSKILALSHTEYLDRVQAIWTAQMIAQMTGVRFEHTQASTLPVTPMTHLPGYAPVDDDYYYEMVAVRAFENTASVSRSNNWDSNGWRTTRDRGDRASRHSSC